MNKSRKCIIAYRCHHCEKLLAMVSVDSSLEIKCPRCKTINLREPCAPLFVRGAYGYSLSKA